jgi:hypothetical protein
MNGMRLVSIFASYGDSWPEGSADQEWTLELRDLTNTWVERETWEHTDGNRYHAHTTLVNTSYGLTTGYTLHIIHRNGAGFTPAAQGYSVTATFQ